MRPLKDNWLVKNYKAAKDIQDIQEKIYKDEVSLLKDAWGWGETDAGETVSLTGSQTMTPRQTFNRVFVNNAGTATLQTGGSSNLTTQSYNSSDDLVERYARRIDVAKKISRIIDDQHNTYSDTDSFYSDDNKELLAKALSGVNAFINKVIENTDASNNMDNTGINKKYILDLNTALLAAIVNENTSPEDLFNIINDISNKAIKSLDDDQNNV